MMPTASETLDLAALDQLEALERAATPGEWKQLAHNVAIERTDGLGLHTVVSGAWAIRRLGWQQAEDNAALIVALRNAAPTLLALARAGLAARQPADIDPALLDRLGARYAADPEPGVCGKCGTALTSEDPVPQPAVNVARRWDCPRRCGGGSRYQKSGDADVLALVRAARRAVRNGR